MVGCLAYPAITDHVHDTTKVILRVRKLSAAVLAGALMFTLAACGNDSGKSSESSTSAAASSSTAASGASETGGAASTTPADETGDQSVLGKVTVTQNNKGAKAPTVKLGAKATADSKVGAKLANPGTGEALKVDSNLSVNIHAIDATTGKVAPKSNYPSAQTIPMKAAAFANGLEGAWPVMQKAKVGADVTLLMPASMTGASPQVWVLHIAKQTEPPKKADAAAVKKLKDAGALPTVTFKDSKPTLTIPKGKDAPSDLIVDVIKEGDGPAAEATSAVTAKYLGVRWADGKKFDSSYDRTPSSTPFTLDGVIPGWTQGLTGVKQGSTVVLTIPGSMAYGDPAPQGQPSGDLVFVVELEKVEAAK